MSSVTPTFSGTTTGDEVVTAFSSRVEGRTFLITGASPASIGAFTVYALAKAHPSILILVGRSPDKLGPVIERIRDIDERIQVVVVQAELSNIASVRKAAAAILEDTRVDHIDVVINNAGIMVGPYRTSEDGIELQFATCHVGHFLLTNLLAPLLRKSAEGGRVVNVSSSGHRMADLAARFDPLLETTTYDEWHSYGFAKLSNILFTSSLAKRGLQAYSLHPGSINTGLQINITPAAREEARKFASHMASFTEPIRGLKTPEQGASTTLVAALSPADALKNGAYLCDCEEHVPSVLGQDKDGKLAEELWAMSEQLVGEEFP